MQIGERYEIQGEIGKGGMGIVYQALDNQSQTLVAIKHLKNLNDTEMLERFQREGQALRDLNHPNIVKMLDMVEQDDSHYLVMEYVSGGDLAQLLKKGQLDLPQILQFALDLADALTRAHKLQIIHRDLKPANILIGADGVLRLTDFGVAHVTQKERVTNTDMIVGTLDYLAPEVFNGAIADAKVDIWAFGIVLFEMLTGTRPFTGKNVSETLGAILKNSIPDLESLRPDAPTALIDLIYRVLEKDPQQRLPSVRIIGVELEALLVGQQNQPLKNSFAQDDSLQLTRASYYLPIQTSPFLGREAELAEIARMLDDSAIRWITILAAGGMGKTRISLAAAEQALEKFSDGVYFVDLVPLQESSQIVSTIAESVGYSFQQDSRSPKQQILDMLRHKKILLVFDNYEHLLDGASIVSEILQAAPHVKILVTSRQRLNLAGETLFHLSGMQFPDFLTPENAQDYAAIKLFVQSAKRALPVFELDKANLTAITEICRLVDGMPLAIVLAAAWLAVLNPQEILQELRGGLDILEAQDGAIPQRQSSIRSVFDYSWQMMSADEQSVFMKLAVFRSGFNREVAEKVAGANVRLLMALVNKSLIRRQSQTGRYSIHELLRQYAEERLKMTGQLALTKAAHADYFIAYAQASWNGYELNVDSIERFAPESDNLRVVWNYLVAESKFAELEIFVYLYGDYIRYLGILQEGIDLFTVALTTLPNLPEKLKAIFYSYLVLFWSGLDLEKATFYNDKAFEIARAYPQSALLADSYAGKLFFMVNEFLSGDESLLDKALSLAQEAYQLAETHQAPILKLEAILALSGIYQNLKQYDEAYRYGKEAIDFALSLGYGQGMTPLWMYGNLGYIETLRGNPEPAFEYLQKSLQLAIAWKHLYAISNQLHTLATFYVNQGQVAESFRYLAESIRWHQRIGKDWQLLGAVYATAYFYASDILAPERLIEILSMVYHHVDTIPLYQHYIEEYRETAKAKLSAAAYEQAWEAGKTQSLKAVVTDLLALYDAQAKGQAD